MNDTRKSDYGFAWRIRVSAALAFGWVVFLVLWLFFFATDFHAYQNIAIIVASLLAVLAFIGMTWMYKMKMPAGCTKAMKEVKGLGSRMLLSMVVLVASIVFFLVWFYFYAVDFSVYQNIAIFIVQVLVTLGILGATWMTFKPVDIDFEGFDFGTDDSCAGMCAGMFGQNESTQEKGVV